MEKETFRIGKQVKVTRKAKLFICCKTRTFFQIPVFQPEDQPNSIPRLAREEDAETYNKHHLLSDLTLRVKIIKRRIEHG